MAEHGADVQARGGRSATRGAAGGAARRLAVSLAAGLLTLLAACGGGGGGGEAAPPPPPPPPPPPAILAAAPAYGAASAPLPSGAREISAQELQRLSDAGAELAFITPETEAVVGDGDAERRRVARAAVQAALGRYPELTEVLATPALPAGALRYSDGTVEVTLPASGRKVLIDPYDTAISDAAYALRMADSRENLLEQYATYLEPLSDEERAALPSPEQAAQLELAALRTAVTQAAEAVIAHVPNEAPPATAAGQASEGRAQALGQQRPLLAGSGCPKSSFSLIEEFGFTLKPHLGPVRDQARRGTCTSFAAAAAVETKLSRQSGRLMDLSEQHLYGVAKLNWFRVSGDFDESVTSADLLEQLRNTGYGFRGEAQWSYNPSSARRKADGRYQQSCDGYDEACSDTNHQTGLVCTTYGTQRWCVWQRPPVTEAVAEQTRIQSLSWLGPLGPSAVVAGSANQTLSHIRASLAAGNPVYLSTNWLECMSELSSDRSGAARYGTSSMLTLPRCDAYGSGNLGGHAVVIVGYVSTLDAMSRLGDKLLFPELDGNPVTDGFFIIRNSHGCEWGDGGYGYFSSAMLRRHAKNAWSINAVSSTNRPSITLKADRSVLDEPGEFVTLTATPGPTVRRVELYKVDRNDPTKATLVDERSSGPFIWQPTIPLASVNLGLHRYHVVGYDAAGAVAKSLVVSVQVKGTALPPPALTLSTTATTVTLPGSVQITAQGERGATTANRTPLRLLQFFKNGVQFAAYSYPLAENRLAVTQSQIVPFLASDVGVVRLSARLTDDAGAVATSEVQINVALAAAPRITSFAASPATTAPGGGPVTLAWSASDFQSLVIDKVGPVTSLSSVQVSPNVTTTYVLTAASQGGNATASATVTVPPPRIDSFTATPASLPVGGGAVTLSWATTGAQGVTISNLGTRPASGTAVVNISANTAWQLSATAPSGSSLAQAAVTVAQDTIAPSVSLAASPAAVDAPGGTTLTATASDNVGVVAVDFFRGSTRIGTDTTPGDGFTQAVAFTQADVGSVNFTAVARDAGGNATTSAPVGVTVRLPAPLGVDRWVAPDGNDANPGSKAAPYLTVGKALANIGASGNAWLAPGTYPWANEMNRNGYSQVDMKVLRVPDTGRVKAVTPGTVTLNFGLQALGSAVISGVHFTLRADDVSDWQPSVLSKGANGTLRVEHATFGRMNNLLYSAGGNTLLTTEGDDAHEWFTPAFQGAFGRVDAGQTRVVGGRITLTRIPDGGNAGARVWGVYGGRGLASFESVRMTLPEAPAGVFQTLFQPVQGGVLTFLNSEIRQLGTRTSHVLAQNDHQSQVRLLRTTVSGPFGQIISLTVGGNVEVNASTLSGGVTGIGFAGGQEPGGVAPPSVQILDSTLRNFSAHALHLPNHGNVLVSGSSIRDNGQAGVFLGGTPNLPWVTANYVLRVQTSTFSGNGSGGTQHGGLVLAGSATSTWDLGGFNGMGGNTLLGSGTSPALRVAVPAGVTVLAVGNTWSPSVQGANAAGQYAGNLLVSSGSGANYSVGSGALRLGY
jgi:hypothetical protein